MNRARAVLLTGLGVKVRLGGPFGLRTDLEYRYLTGAPGVASELALLFGVVALW